MIRNYITNIVVIIVVAVGLIAIGGWFSEMEKIRPLVSSIASTKFNTSLCLIFSAIALYVFNRGENKKIFWRIGVVCAYAVVVIASLTLVEYITGIKLGIDQIIVNEIGAEANPGRIELFACMLFLTVGIILLKLKSAKQYILIQILLPIVFFVAVFITFNYISGLSYLESMPFAVNTALTTSLSIMALCIGIFYSGPLRQLKFSFERRIASYFGVAIMLLGIVFFSFSANNQKLIQSTKTDHTKEVLFKTSSVFAEAQDIETAARGFLITSREEFLEPFNKSSVTILSIIADIKTLTSQSSEQKEKVDSLLSLAQQNIELRKTLVQYKREGFIEPIFSIMAIGAEKKLMDQLREVIADIQRTENRLFKERNDEINQTIQGSQRIITAIELLVLLVLIIVFIIIYRNTISRNEAEAALRKSESFIKSVVDNAASTITIKDVSGRYLLVNKEAQKSLGFTEKEVLGKTPYDFFPAEVADETRSHAEEVLKTGRLIERSIKSLGPNGVKHFITVKFPLFDENQNIYAVGSMTTDITVVKEAQILVEAAHKEQQLILNGIQNLMDASLDIICMVDKFGRLIQISANCKQLFGYEPEEMIGRLYVDFLVPEDREISIQQASGVAKGSIAKDFENRGVCKDGTVVPLIWTAIWSPENKTFYAIVKDATEKKMTARQLTELNENLKKRASELQASNTELERFAYVASHDLQEPLRMVSSFLQLLEKKLEGTLDETGKKYISFAVDGAERMKVLIQDLLQYSRVGTSKELVVNVDLDEVLKSVLMIFALAIKETNAELLIHPLPVIKAEKGQMHQLFQNLIGNAIKYSSPHAPKIEIGYEDLQDAWQFYVKDHGIGINPKFFEKIFIIFQRLHNKSEYSGTGIGLALCKKIVERHGGSIWVESEPGKGSTFFIKLPKY